jgi:hypothetical protein
LTRIIPERIAGRDPVRPRQVGGPQPAAEAVLGAIGEGDSLLFGAEGADRNDGVEDLVLAHLAVGFGPDDGGLQVVASGEAGVARRRSAG